MEIFEHACMFCMCGHVTGSGSMEASLQGVKQRGFPLAAEGAAEVIHGHGPDKSSTETTLLQPVSLWTGPSGLKVT